jgi:hypothetical protein
MRVEARLSYLDLRSRKRSIGEQAVLPSRAPLAVVFTVHGLLIAAESVVGSDALAASWLRPVTKQQPNQPDQVRHARTHTQTLG